MSLVIKTPTEEYAQLSVFVSRGREIIDEAILIGKDILLAYSIYDKAPSVDLVAHLVLSYCLRV